MCGQDKEGGGCDLKKRKRRRGSESGGVVGEVEGSGRHYLAIDTTNKVTGLHFMLDLLIGYRVL